jgi:creatinine amidohydrolase
MELKDLSWPQVAAMGKDVPVVIPVAALEQHGHHLPVFTDSMLLGEIVRRVMSRFEKTVLFAPLMWLGNSDHHLEFPGTLSSPPRTYLDLLSGLLENLLTHGFKRLLILNGHGGNDVPARQVIFETRQRHRARTDLLLLAATYWNLGGRPHEVDSTISQKQMGHACEWETSMILRIAPQLVGDFAKVEPVGFDDAFEGIPRGWITKDRTQPGHIGYPHLATAEKGEVLLNVFAEDVAGLIQRVINWDGKSWA